MMTSLEGVGQLVADAVGAFTSGIAVTILAGWFYLKRVQVQTAPALLEAQGKLKASTTGYLLELLARQDNRIADLEQRLLAEQARCAEEMRQAVRTAVEQVLAGRRDIGGLTA